MLDKNMEFTGFVEALGSNGEGIVKSEGTTFFAPYTLTGEKVKLKALKVKNKIGYAKVLEVYTPADERVRPVCKNFMRCGGCQLQHVKYTSQLKLKQKTVRDALVKIAGIDTEVLPTIKSDEPFAYRNKLQIPVGVGADGQNVIGFFAERSHRIVPLKTCPIHPEWAETVIAVFYTYMEKCGLCGYDDATGRGDIRSIVVRDVAGNLIVTVVATHRDLKGIGELIRLLSEKLSSFSLYLNLNDADTNVVFGEEFILLYGAGRYTATECGIKYEVGANTFIQVNSGVCRKLYDRTVKAAAESGCTAAIDCYSGGGLMTAMLAKTLGKAYGIEIVREAVDCADGLKSLNKLQDKMSNRCGKVEDILPSVLEEVDADQCFLVVDPPRKGVDRATLRAILKSGVKKMAMISCDPATMARDAGVLTGALTEIDGELRKNPDYRKNGGGHFKIQCVQPFDMFPQTKHVETLVVLSHKKPDSHLEVKIDFDNTSLDKTAIAERAEKRKPQEKTTYKKIQEWIEENYGFKVHTAYVAEVKRELGLPMYDAPNAVDELKRPRQHPTEQMTTAIKAALKYFEII